MVKSKNLSLESKGLRYKLKIAFYLMSVLPLLICIYLVSNYILPSGGYKLDIIASVAIIIFIAWIGFYVVKEIFDRILSVSSEAKLIAAGDIGRKIKIKKEDEVGDLSQALNQLTDRIRTNLEELKNYSERTKEIDLEIERRIFLLSSLLQISSLISQGVNLEEILKFITEKSRLLANSDVAYLFLRKEDTEPFSIKIADGKSSESFIHINIEPQDEIFHKLINTNKPLVIDHNKEVPEDFKALFYKKFKLKNTLALPVSLKKKIIGILGIGNLEESFSYRKDDLELLDIFAKQISIALENDVLTHQIKELEIKDALTDLYNEAFIRNRLKEEIKRAITYQRPCAFILLNINNFAEIQQSFGLVYAEGTLKKVASVIKNSVGEVDRVARTSNNEFAIILPERNKRQAKNIAEDIRKKIEFAFSEEQDAHKKVKVTVGVSENPIDGIDDEELISKARAALNISKT